MRAQSLFIMVLAAVGLFSSAPAHAGTLRTPFVAVNADQRILVKVTNIGAKEIDPPTVVLRAASGTVATPSSESCPDGPLAAGATCLVHYASDVDGFATIESSGKFRAAIQVVGPNSPSGEPLVTVVPATK